MTRRAAISLVCLLAVAGPTGAARRPALLFADLILHSGKILTVDATFRIAEALAIRTGRIVAVGSDREILTLRGPATAMRDLRGRAAVPGLIDSHSHLTQYGMRLFRPDLSKAASVAEIVALIASKVRSSAPGEWITNSGFWNETKLAERRSPTLFDLDPISPANPVFLSRGHLGVANSAALRAVGVTEDTPDPPGGRLERDPNTGALTGRLYESAQELVRAALPEPTHDELMAAQLDSFRALAAAGVTSVRSASETAAGVRALIELRRRGELAIRTSVALRIDPNMPAEQLETILREAPAASGMGDEFLSLWGVKMVADGGSDLAHLRKDYVNRPGFRGQPGATAESFTRAVTLCRKYGWRVGIHALGDAAIDMVLDAYEAADREKPISGERWSIEHGYLLQPDHVARIKRLGLIVHPQTWHLYNLRRNFVENYGAAYAAMSHPYRTLIRAGIPIAGGTDWPLQPADQFFYMWVEMTRATIDGEIVGEEHRLSREDALRFHTIWAAYSTFDEHLKGSLEPGKLADLVVLSHDYLTVPVDRVKMITPILTMVGGKVVFERSDLAKRVSPEGARARSGSSTGT